MKILVIHNDVNLVNAMRLFFESRHQCHLTVHMHARDKATAFCNINFSQYDAVILGMVLPYEDGISICRKIRALNAIPILIIADIEKIKQSAICDKLGIDTNDNMFFDLSILALKAGADDIVQSNILMSELFARVRNIINRCVEPVAVNALENMDRQYLFSFNEGENICFDMTKMQLTSNYGLSVELTTSEGELLAIFLASPRKMLSRDYLIQKIKMRDYHGPSDRFIDVRIGMLRKKLFDYQYKFIRTVRGKGYFFDAEVIEKVR